MQKIRKGDSVIIQDKRPFWKNKKGVIISDIIDESSVKVRINIAENKNVIETFLLCDLELIDSSPHVLETLNEKSLEFSSKNNADNYNKLLSTHKNINTDFSEDLTKDITTAKQFIEHFINMDCKFLGFDYDELYAKYENEDGEYVFYDDDLEYIDYFKYLETLKCKIIGCSMYEYSKEESLMDNFKDSFWTLLFENGEKLEAVCGESIRLLNQTKSELKEVVNKDIDIIKPYLADENDWFFISKIAVAEDIDESKVISLAKKFNYSIFEIFTETKVSYIVAKKNSNAEDIITEYASYLPGFKKIERVK